MRYFFYDLLMSFSVTHSFARSFNNHERKSSTFNVWGGGGGRIWFSNVIYGHFNM